MTWRSEFGRSPQCTSFAESERKTSAVGSPDWLSSCGQIPSGTPLPDLLPPGIRESMKSNGTMRCCGSCVIFVPRVQLRYFPEDADVPCSVSTDTADSAMITSAPRIQSDRTSVFVEDGFTYTSPSLYFEIVGTASFEDRCGQLGTEVVDSTIAIPPGVMSTVSFDVSVGDHLPTGSQARQLRQIVPLKTRDLLCPTWGVNMAIPSQGAQTVRVGPPFYPLLVPPPQLITMNEAWSKCVGNHRPLRYGIFDPPRALTANSVILPSPSVPAAQPDSDPTATAAPGTSGSGDTPPPNAPAPAIPPENPISNPTPAPGMPESLPSGQNDPTLESNPDAENPDTQYISDTQYIPDKGDGDGNDYDYGDDYDDDDDDSGNGGSPGSSEPYVQQSENPGMAPSGSDTSAVDPWNMDENDGDSAASGIGTPDSGPESPGSESGSLGSNPGADGDSYNVPNPLEGYIGTAMPNPMVPQVMTIAGKAYTEALDCSCYSLAPGVSLAPGGIVTLAQGTVVTLASNGASAIIDGSSQLLLPAVTGVAPAFAGVLSTKDTSGPGTSVGGGYITSAQSSAVVITISDLGQASDTASGAAGSSTVEPARPSHSSDQSRLSIPWWEGSLICSAILVLSFA